VAAREGVLHLLANVPEVKVAQDFLPKRRSCSREAMHDVTGRMAIAALALASCAPQATTSEQSSGVRTVAGKSTATAAALPPATSAAVAPSAPDEQQESPRPPRSGAPGSTKGTVACGKVRCKAPGESCGWDEGKRAWACEPTKRDPAAAADFERALYACDDGTDCPAGETCCVEWENRTFASHTCVARRNVQSQCMVEVCLPDGARCPNGRTCVVTSATFGNDTAVEGTCNAPKGTATCAEKKKCPADQPICVLADKGLQCVAEGSATYKSASAHKRFECTRQGDCNAGESCQYSFGEAPEVRSFCWNYNPAFMGTLVCEPGDPNFCGKDKECLARQTCHHAEGDPPWLGAVVSKK
jgi:hypothetical protein